MPWVLRCHDSRNAALARNAAGAVQTVAKADGGSVFGEQFV